jgi:hypothetical protein
MSCCLLASLLFSGCAVPGSEPTTTADLVATVSPRQAGVILGSETQCLYTEATAESALVGALAAAIVPKLVDRGVSALADWIEARRVAREQSFRASYTARGAGQLYTTAGKPLVKCVMIYRGLRGRATAADGDWTVDDLRTLGLREAPEFFLELKVEPAYNNVAFRLIPQRLDYQKTAAQRSKGSKDVLVVGVVEGAFGQAADAAGAGLGAFEVSFPALPEGTVWEKADMVGLTSQWIPMPAPPRNEDGEVISTIPISVLVNVQEAEEGSDLLLGVLGALSEAAAESKDSISEQISNDIIRRLGLEQPADSEEDAGAQGGDTGAQGGDTGAQGGEAQQ